VPRPRDGECAAPGFDVELALLIGPDADISDRELEAGWRAVGDRLCEEHANAGWRPWGWWAFTAREPMPNSRDGEVLRLAELEELTDVELAALAERAHEARLRVNTDRERLADSKSIDAPSIALWEQVKALAA
jgi:hypothetical protein